MPREYQAYLNDIRDCIRKIEKYTEKMLFADFEDDELIQDAVIRNLEIIGEAAKKIPSSIKDEGPGIEWNQIAGLRNLLAHAYFGVDLEIIWDVIKNEIPKLKNELKKF